MNKSRFKGIASIAVVVLHVALLTYIIWEGLYGRLHFERESLPLAGLIAPLFAAFVWAALRYATEAKDPVGIESVQGIFVGFFFVFLGVFGGLVVAVVHGFAREGFPIATVAQAAGAIGLVETLFGGMLGYLFFHVFDQAKDTTVPKAVAGAPGPVTPTLAPGPVDGTVGATSED